MTNIAKFIALKLCGLKEHDQCLTEEWAPHNRCPTGSSRARCTKTGVGFGAEYVPLHVPGIGYVLTSADWELDD